MLNIKTGNQGLVKQLNKSIVLNVIRNNEHISRAEVSKLTGLNKATVSSLVEELMEDQYVLEAGIGVSTGGRRPLMLSFNDQAGSLVGIELGVNYIYIILSDLNANILWEKKESIGLNEKQSIIDQMLRLIQEAIDFSPDSHYGIMGIGAGVPGIVNVDEGHVLVSPNVNLNHVDLAAILRGRFPKAVIKIDNEANLGALGEKWFGAGRHYNHLTYISAGMGIGAGIILNDQLYSGMDGIAGEVGHTTIVVDGLPCNCGGRGCWEMYASERAVQERVIEAVQSGTFKWPPDLQEEEIPVRQLKTLADQGNTTIQNIFSEVGYYLGVGAANIAHYYNPQAIIIGNTMQQAQELILEPMKEVTQKRVILGGSTYPQILLSELGEKSSVIGAISAILVEILNIPSAGIQSK